MNDERYVFVQDTKEKKSTARSARSKRTHTGKGGSVKLPSDYMTKKEINAMSGECKSYRLNESMKWKEFKAMPDDIKVSYINLIRQKYNAPDNHICKMMGTNVCSFSQEMHRLDVPSTRKAHEKLDKDGFYEWVVPTPKEDPAEEPFVENCEPIPDHIVAFAEETDNEPYTIPVEGNMTFMCNADSALETMKKILGSETVRITISWEAVND